MMTKLIEQAVDLMSFSDYSNIFTKQDGLSEASKATDDGLQTRMDKNFTKSVATRYDGTRKQEAEGKKGLVKTANIIKSRGGDAAAAKQKASDKNDYENEM